MRKGVKDILQWEECFAIYTEVLASKFPAAVPDLLAYMLMILKAQREYEEGQGSGNGQLEVGPSGRTPVQPGVYGSGPSDPGV